MSGSPTTVALNRLQLHVATRSVMIPSLLSTKSEKFSNHPEKNVSAN
jgi:hypothetical protein